MADQIRDVGAVVEGDDQAWKAEVERVLTALIAGQYASDTEIEALQGRVN